MSLVNLGLSALDFWHGESVCKVSKEWKTPNWGSMIETETSWRPNAWGTHDAWEIKRGKIRTVIIKNPSPGHKKINKMWQKEMRCVSVYIYIWIICDDLHLGPSDNLSFFFYTFVARWLDSSGSRHPHLIPGLDKLAAVTRSNGERGFLGKCGLLPWLKNAIPENRAIYFKGILKGQCWLIFFFF